MNNKIISKITSGVLVCTIFAYCTPVFAFTKDETVYSKLDSSGSSYNTIVNNHIENEGQEDIINDLSDLLNIRNVNGDEEFKQDGNSLVWKANGNDIYYQGETRKELPIECNVKYELDGKEISAEELVGKSGKVKITIEYINKDEHIVNINGKDEKLYTPFVVACGTIIDNDNNRNIEITNGKVIDNGNKTAVLGISLPGMQESLGISNDKLGIQNTVEIIMDTTNFELNTIVTYVTPKVIEDSDLDLFDKMDEIYSKVDTLQSASKQLEVGVNTLEEGTNTYSQKSKEFNNAMKEVATGVSSASDSYSKIDDGISLLNKNSSTLQLGAKSVSEGTEAVSTNLKTINEKLRELQTGIKGLQTGERQLKDGLEEIILSTSGIQMTDNSAKIKELNQLIFANENTVKKLEKANIELNLVLDSIEDETAKQTINNQIETNNSTISLLETNIGADKETIATLEKVDMSNIKELQSGLNNLKKGIEDIQAGTDKLYNGGATLNAGTEVLCSKTEELTKGSKSLYKGTVSVSEGTKVLNVGSTEMKKGLNILDDGTGKLTDASNQLTDGANTISDGVITLAEGVTAFNKEGIETICNYINGDLKDITVRLEKLQELSEKYNNFTMINDGTEGRLKFIMIMDSIKKEENGEKEVIIDDKNNKEE